MGLARVLTKGWPVVVELAATLPGPPPVVWDLITDWERQGDWMREASDLRVLGEQREGPGVEAVATIRIGGITTEDRIRVVAWEPLRRLAIEHRGWVTGLGEILLTPLGPDRTHFFWREELNPPLGLLGALGMTLFKPLLARTFRRDLTILTALVRTRAATRA